MPEKRATGVLGRGVLLVELVVGMAAGVYSLRVAAAYARPLARLHGSVFTWTVAGVVAGLLLGLLAIRVVLRARPGPRLAPVLRGTLVVLVLAYAGFLAFVQPYHGLHARLYVGVVGLLGAAGALALARFGSATWWRRLDFVLFQLCAVALGLELSLRVVAAVRPSPLLARGDTRAEDVLAAQRMPPGVLHLHYPTNSRGFYDEELRPRRPGERLVVSIGDSFSFGAAHHYWHFTTVCERTLRDVMVYNVGAPGVGPLEYLYLLQREVGYLDPDALVIALFVGNDLDPPNLERAKRPIDPRLWLDRNNLLLYLVPQRLARLRAERKALGDVEDDHRAGALIGRDEALAEMPWLEDPLSETIQQSDETFARIEISRARVVCTEDGVQYSLVHDYFEEVLRACAGTPLYVLVIPDEFQVEDAVWSLVLEHVTDVELDRFRPQRELAKVFEDLGIEYLDLLPVLSAAEPLSDGRKHVYYIQDTHLNARGQHLVGEALAAFLARRLQTW